jgi:hypothetical protein
LHSSSCKKAGYEYDKFEDAAAQWTAAGFQTNVNFFISFYLILSNILVF